MNRRWTHIRGVLLDKDGTILDYEKTWLPINRQIAMAAAGGDLRLANELLREGGQDPVTNRIIPGSPFAAGTVDEIAACFSAILGPSTPAGLASEIDAIFARGGAETAVLIDGVAEAIDTLKRRGIAVGVATNDSISGMKASLARVGLLDRFDVLLAADSGYGGKPGPGMATAFSELTTLDPSQLAVVGDAVHDLEMARRAGYGLKVAVLSGTGTREDLGRHADVTLQSLCDVPELLSA